MAETEALQHKVLIELEMQWRRRQGFTAPEAAARSLRSFFRKVCVRSGHKMRSCLFSMSCSFTTVILCSSVYRLEFSKLDARSLRPEGSVEASAGLGILNLEPATGGAPRCPLACVMTLKCSRQATALTTQHLRTPR
jgi:hypothetical protein